MKICEWREPAMPWWLTALLAAGAVWILHGLYRDVFGNVWAMLPLTGVIAYLLAALFVNRMHVRIDRNGFQRSFGPLPLGPGEAPVPAARVRLVFVRWANVTAGRTVARRLLAGIETVDGRIVDITDPGKSEPEVWAAAQEMAEALGGHAPVTPIGERGTQIPQAHVQGLLIWCGAAGASIFWAIAVQLVRSFF
jgi:hypothetical protein